MPLARCLNSPNTSGEGAERDCAPAGRAALVIGHPGHELRVFGWTARERPVVHALTDGSGGRGTSRSAASAELVERLGAVRGPVFGDAPDAEYYRAILAGDAAFFRSLVDRLARSFVESRVDFVASDAVEGFNPVHDLCSTMTAAAAAIASAAKATPIRHYEFTLSEWEAGLGAANVVCHDETCRHLTLSDEIFACKLEAACEYGALKSEVAHALDAMGEDYFRVECLREARAAVAPIAKTWRPFYERFAEGRVAEGAFSTVIRYREHVAPIVLAIFEHARAGETIAA